MSLLKQKWFQITIGIIALIIVIRWVYNWAQRRTIPFYHGPYNKSNSVIQS